MRNGVILGSGRSGTSAFAGLVSGAGYFMGANLIPADEANPKGYFEDWEVNSINENLLAPVVPRRPAGVVGDLLFPARLAPDQRWLAAIPLGVRITPTPALAERIRALTRKEPWCFKDPRFSYTLPAWHPYIGGALRLCVFRDPGVTADSLVKEAGRDARSRRIHLRFGYRRALAVWEAMYSHILRVREAQGGEWLFLHYQQLWDGTAIARLERALDVRVDAGFPDRSLNRANPHRRFPGRIARLYDELCRAADFTPM